MSESKKKPLEKEKTNQEELGKKFEDLTPEEMQKYKAAVICKRKDHWI